MHLSPLLQWLSLLSVLKAMVLLLLILCCLLLPLWDSVIVYFVSNTSFAIILIGKRELVTLLGLSRYCCVALPRGAMGWSAACDCHTHYLLHNAVVIKKNIRIYNYQKNESEMLAYNFRPFRLASETPFEWRFTGGPIVLVFFTI